MDGENKGKKPYEQMDDLGVKTPIFGNTHIGAVGASFEACRFLVLMLPMPLCTTLRGTVCHWGEGVTRYPQQDSLI